MVLFLIKNICEIELWGHWFFLKIAMGNLVQYSFFSVFVCICEFYNGSLYKINICVTWVKFLHCSGISVVLTIR